MRTVQLVSSLGPNATARYLATVLPRLEGEHAVINCGDRQPFAESFRTVPVTELRFRCSFDLAAAMDLRNRVRDFAPAIVHAWGDRAFAYSLALSGLPQMKWVAGDRRRQGAWSKVFGARRGIARFDSSPVRVDAPVAAVALASLGLPAGARMILNAGGFDHRSDQRSAVWAYDMLRYADPSLHLVLAGDGPLRPQVERFARSIARGDVRIHFPGVRSDLPAWLASASVAYSTHRDGGRQFAAEAHAIGTPLVAIEGANAVLRAGVDCLLAPRARYADQAAALKRLLENSTLVDSIVAGGRAVSYPSADAAAARLAAFYRGLSG